MSFTTDATIDEGGDLQNTGQQSTPTAIPGTYPYQPGPSVLVQETGQTQVRRVRQPVPGE